METSVLDVTVRLLAVLALVLANGFFVAAEFSIISVRKTRIDQLLAEGSRMARPVRRALNNPDQFIAATQLGITMASLGLGWIGEPALASLLEPLLRFAACADLRGHVPHHRRHRRVHHHHGSSYRAWRAGAEDSRASVSGENVTDRCEADRTVSQILQSVHPRLERHGLGRGPDVRAEGRQRSWTGSFGGRAQDARHGESAGRRARRRRGADAPPRVPFRGVHRSRDDGSANRNGGGEGRRVDC